MTATCESLYQQANIIAAQAVTADEQHDYSTAAALYAHVAALLQRGVSCDADQNRKNKMLVREGKQKKIPELHCQTWMNAGNIFLVGERVKVWTRILLVCVCLFGSFSLSLSQLSLCKELDLL